MTLKQLIKTKINNNNNQKERMEKVMKKLSKIFVLTFGVLTMFTQVKLSASDGQDELEENTTKVAFLAQVGSSIEEIPVYGCSGHLNQMISQINRHYYPGNFMWCSGPLGCRGYLVRKNLTETITLAESNQSLNN